MEQAARTTRLKQLAFVYIPLTFVTCVFGMNLTSLSNAPCLVVLCNLGHCRGGYCCRLRRLRAYYVQAAAERCGRIYTAAGRGTHSRHVFSPDVESLQLYLSACMKRRSSGRYGLGSQLRALSQLGQSRATAIKLYARCRQRSKLLSVPFPTELSFRDVWLAFRWVIERRALYYTSTYQRQSMEGDGRKTRRQW